MSEHEQEHDFANSQLLSHEDMHVTRPKSSQVSRVAAAAAAAAAAADDELKSYVTKRAAALHPGSPEMQQKLIEFAMLYDKLRKGEITQFEFEAQSMDNDLTDDQKQVASMLCLERLGGKKNLVIQRQIKCVGLSPGLSQTNGLSPGQTNGLSPGQINGLGLGNNTILFISNIRSAHLKRIF
jgi:hypothetical protein